MSATEDLLIRKLPPGAGEAGQKAERRLVGNLLNRPELLDEPEIATLCPEDFYSSKCATLYELAVSRGPHAKEVTLEEVQAHLEATNVEGVAWALEILDVGFGDWRWSAKHVRENGIRRHVIHEAARLQQLAFDPSCRDPLEVLSSAAARLAGSVGNTKPSEVRTLAELGGEFLEGLDRAMRGETVAYSTGFGGLDDLFGGGFQAGDLCVIGARPSCGKTSLARNIARNMAFAGTKAVFFSLEVPRRQYYRDVITGESGIPAQLLRSGKLNDNQLGRVRDHADWLSTDPRGKNLGIVERINDLGRILSIARAQARLHEVKVVFVDYLQLVRSRGHKDKRHEVSEASARLKHLALEHEVAVVALAQLKRSADEDANRQPRMSDLKESGDIEQDADQIVLIHRPGLAASRSGKRGAEKVDKSLAELLVVKNRSGMAPAKVNLRFEGRSMRFYPLDLEPRPPAQQGRPGWKPKAKGAK